MKQKQTTDIDNRLVDAKGEEGKGGRDALGVWD